VGDGGSKSDGGNAADGGTACALYGQECTPGADCCNNIPRSDDNAPCTGESTCTCHYTIQ